MQTVSKFRCLQGTGATYHGYLYASSKVQWPPKQVNQPAMTTMSEPLILRTNCERVIKRPSTCQLHLLENTLRWTNMLRWTQLSFRTPVDPWSLMAYKPLLTGTQSKRTVSALSVKTVRTLRQPAGWIAWSPNVHRKSLGETFAAASWITPLEFWTPISLTRKTATANESIAKAHRAACIRLRTSKKPTFRGWWGLGKYELREWKSLMALSDNEPLQLSSTLWARTLWVDGREKERRLGTQKRLYKKEGTLSPVTLTANHIARCNGQRRPE